MAENITNSSISFPNLWHNDKWAISFSNLPSLGTMHDMRIYDNFVKSVTFPDYNMGEIYSDIKGFRIRHPLGGMNANIDLSQLQIEFKLSEDMRNYMNLFEWMQALRYGKVEDFNTEEEFYRKYTIKSINLNIFDNQKRTIAVWRFTEAFLLSLSSFSLVNGTSDEVTFTTNFSYQEIFYQPKTVQGNCEN
jgi:hypothetical protein